MLIQINVIEFLLRKLHDKGWRQNAGYAIRGNPRVLECNGRKIAVVNPIRINPYKNLQDEIDVFFRSLLEIILKNGIKDVLLPGGGTIPVPQFFLDYCKDNGIKIHIVTLEDIDKFDNLEI